MQPHDRLVLKLKHLRQYLPLVAQSSMDECIAMAQCSAEKEKPVVYGLKKAHGENAD